MDKFLSFDKMITPMIIKILFWVGVALSVLVGLGTIISGLNSYYGGGVEILMGLFMIILGPVVVRIYCELLIIFFKMQESITEIKDQLSKSEE